MKIKRVQVVSVTTGEVISEREFTGNLVFRYIDEDGEYVSVGEIDIRDHEQKE